MQEGNSTLLTFLGYLAVVGIVTFGVFYLLKNKDVQVATQKDVVAENTPVVENKNTKMQENVTELKIEDLVVGTGAEAVSGKVISVHYTGTLTDGTKFDSSVDRGTPFEFTLGAGQVIQGWDQGFAGMKVGGKRRLTIPSSLGYGDAGTPGGPIPPKATLIFEVELLGAK